MREGDGYLQLVPGIPEGGQEKVVFQLGWSQSIVIPKNRQVLIVWVVVWRGRIPFGTLDHVMMIFFKFLVL